MYKTYAVMFMNQNSKHIGHDSFYCKNEMDARQAFRDCYRHGDYLILAVVAIPEEMEV